MLLMTRLLTILCLLVMGTASADDGVVRKQLVDVNLLYAVPDAGGNDDFHTGKMLAINYNYYFKPWLAATASLLLTEEIPEKQQTDVAGDYRGIIETQAIILGVRPEYAFSDRNKIYGRAGLLAYQTELKVEQYFGTGLPNATTSADTDGFGYMAAFGWAHNFTARFSFQAELNYMVQSDLFEESPNAFDLTSGGGGFGFGYAF
jgi:opacity protein-like surface antigen